MPKNTPSRPLRTWPPDGSGAPHAYTMSCSPEPTSPHHARRFVAGVLRSYALTTLLDDAVLCTSELVTNACVHTRQGTVGAVLRMEVGGRGARAASVKVTVYDGDPGARPRLLEGYDPESGRGLWLVDILSRGRWGVVSEAPFTGGGKGVWFELCCRDGVDVRAGRPLHVAP